MKIIKDERGFTLIEMLVVINLSFLVISAVVSLYLLTNKYFLGTTKRFEEKETTLDFIYKLEEHLKRTDHYFFALSSDSLQILSERDTINFLKDRITSHILSGIDNIKSFETKLLFLSGKEIIISNENNSERVNPGESLFFSSDSVAAISLMIERGRKYRATIYNNQTPYKLFRNM